MEAMVLEMLRTHTQIFWKKCPSNGMNPWTSINVVFWQGILLVFYRTNALERFAISHFAKENPRITPTTKERSNHKNALRT